MSLLKRIASEHKVADISQAPDSVRATIYRETVSALDWALDSEQIKVTEQVLKVFTQDLNLVIKGVRTIDPASFKSRDGILALLRDARSVLYDAYSQLEQGQRKRLTLFDD